MFMQLHRPARCAPSPSTARDRRSLERLLTVLYATLVLASIWKLDGDDVLRDATPPATGAATVARARALMLGFAESLRRVPHDSVPLSRDQATPEGWPLWVDAHPAAIHDEGAATAAPTRAPD